MVDTTVTCNVSPCQVVLSFETPLLNMDVAGGAQIASAVLVVWVIGWAFRMLIKALNIDSGKSTESE